MYHNPVLPVAVPAGAAGSIALTAPVSPFWAVLGAFAIFAAAQAVLRILPRRGVL